MTTRRSNQRDPYLADREWLESRYRSGASYDEIAAQAGASTSSVGRWIKVHDLPRRSFTRLADAEWLREQRDRGLTVQEIADLLGVRRSAVSRAVKRHRLPLRERSRAPNPAIEGREDWIVDQYHNQRRSLVDIGKEIGASAAILSKWLRRQGLSGRAGRGGGRPSLLPSPETLAAEVDAMGSLAAVARANAVSETAIRRHIRRAVAKGPSVVPIGDRPAANRNHRLADRAWMAEQLARGKSQAQIAQIAGAHPGTVSLWVKRHELGAPRRLSARRPRSNLPQEVLDSIHDLYWGGGMSLIGVADRVGVTPKTVRRALRAMGTPPRPSGRRVVGTGADHKLADREWLHHQYVTLSRSQVDIAREVGMSSGSVFRWIHRHGIRR